MAEFGFTFDGVNFNGDSYRVFVVNRRHSFLPAPLVDIRQLAHTDGGVSQGATWGPRVFDLTCWVAEKFISPSASPDVARDTLIANIAAKLVTAQEGEKTFVPGWDSGKSWLVRLMSGFDVDVALTGGEFNLQFIAPNPWAKATSSTNAQETVTGDTTAAVTPGGDRPTAVTWIFKNGGTASAGAITLQNTTRGESVTWTGPIGANDWIRFNSETGLVETSSNSGGAWASVMSGVTGTVPGYNGGVSNTVKLLGAVSGTLDFTYFARSF